MATPLPLRFRWLWPLLPPSTVMDDAPKLTLPRHPGDSSKSPCCVQARPLLVLGFGVLSVMPSLLPSGAMRCSCIAVVVVLFVLMRCCGRCLGSVRVAAPFGCSPCRRALVSPSASSSNLQRGPLLSSLEAAVAAGGAAGAARARGGGEEEEGVPVLAWHGGAAGYQEVPEVNPTAPPLRAIPPPGDLRTKI